MSRVLNDTTTRRLAAAAGTSPLFDRLQYAFGPLTAGILLDVLDFTTFGPVGLFCGFLMGAPLGWWLASCHRLPFDWKVLCAVLAGVYCTVPFTEFVPLATLLAAFVRFHESGRTADATTDDAARDVESEVVDESDE